VSVTAYYFLAAVLFSIGCTAVLVRRNAIVAFMGVELMLNASNLVLVASANQYKGITGQVSAFFVMVVAAAEVVVGLAIIIAVFRARETISLDEPSELRG